MVSRNTIERKSDHCTTKKDRIHCTLCGNTFEKGANSACTHCPFHKKDCGFVKCPNCGFDIPVSSKLWEWLKKMGRLLK